MSFAALRSDFSDNRKIFGRARVIEKYAAATNLQKPEAAILELLRPDLAGMRMLDLGVGTGRTTLHFAGLVREYLGIDYIHAMVDYCRKHGEGFPGRPRFRCHDARELHTLETDPFDFILFSYNGLDFAAHADRLKILREIRNALKPGGVFCFSSHNLYAIMRRWDWREDWKRKRLGRELPLRLIFFLLHGSARRLERRDWAVVRDGAQAFRIRNYAIKPEAQLRQLADAGFPKTRIYSIASGTDITDAPEAARIPDRWLYYLCRI